ncbi:hypothetical protein BJX65DRAFT_313431 [Aspergillus insuetus]
MALAVNQSSAVSDLKTLDMIEVTRQSRDREEAQRTAREMREKLQILLDPRSYAKVVSTRISDDYRLGVWFPRDSSRPRLIWVPSDSREYGFHIPVFDPYLVPDNMLLRTIPFKVNNIRGIELDHWLTIWYRDDDGITNQSVLAAVEACHPVTVPCHLKGDFVVMSGQQGSYTGTLSHDFEDVTLADFRHALDFFSTYFDETIRETSSGGCVAAVKISSPREQSIYGLELFTSVAVSRNFPSNSNISPISRALGVPIWRRREKDGRTRTPAS